MIKSIAAITLLSSIFTFLNFGTSTVSTTAVVTIAGAIIKSRETPVITKYARKDCPVCKGKGWYISGDGIEKVDCGYCEEK